jgi:small conductance mechanosensitive channel
LFDYLCPGTYFFFIALIAGVLEFSKIAGAAVGITKLGEWLDALVVMLPNLVLATLVLGISLFAARYLKKIMRNGLMRTGANETVVSFLTNIIVAVFMLVSLFVVLNSLNLDDALTALLDTAGVAGLAVGLALQNPLITIKK